MESRLRSKRPEHGIATIEFAIVAPILLLLMLATAELGRAFFTYNTLHKAVRDGTRYLSVHALNGTTGTIDIAAKTAETQNLVVYGKTAGGSQPLLPGLTLGQVTVSSPDAENVQVDAVYPYSPLFTNGIPTFGLGSGNITVSFNMSSSVTMRAIQ
ncbi:MAG: TadE/TadG family type IV pilus assembly protein [Gammaproteobacteria bacterium]